MFYYEKLLLSKDIIESIIDSFITALPCYLKEKLVFCPAKVELNIIDFRHI